MNRLVFAGFALGLVIGSAISWVAATSRTKSRPVVSTPQKSTAGGTPDTAAAASSAAARDAISPEAARSLAAGINPADSKEAVKTLRRLFESSRSAVRGNAAVFAAVERWSAADLSAVAAELAREGSLSWNPASNSLRQAVLSRWAELAPQEALAFALQSPPNDYQIVQPIFAQLAITRPGDLEAALAGMTGYKRRNALSAAAAAMVETNPHAAVDLLRRHEGTSAGGAWYSVLHSWAAKDPDGAAQFALDQKEGPIRANALSSVCQALGVADPERAWAFASNLPKMSERFNMRQNVISAVAGRDPQAAIALVDRQPERDRKQLREHLAYVWAQRDSDAAVEWVNTLPDKSERNKHLLSMAQNMDYYDAEKGFAIATMLPEGQDRRNVLQSLASRLAYSNAEKGLELINALPESDRVAMLERFASSVAYYQPQMAREIASSLPPTDGARRAQQNLARSLVDDNADKALEWAATLETERARIDVTSAALSAWADREPDKAAEATARLTDANARRKAREDIASTWANRAPAEAEQWASSLPAEDRFSALAAIWKVAAKDDPAAAGNKISSEIQAAAGVDGATDKLAAAAQQAASAWCGRNPSEAAAWSLSLPEGKVREEAIAGVAKQWTDVDTMAASEWISQLPEGRARDQAAAPLIHKIASSDPEAAFAWASSLQNIDKRVESLKATLTTWKSFNPAAARQAFEGSALTDDVRSRLKDVVP